MNKITQVFVGVDVSKRKLDVHINPLRKALLVDNTDKGIKQLIGALKPYRVARMVCESSGGYEALMIKMFRNEGINVWQVEPKRIKAFIYSEGKRAKTDKIDAEMIALFASQKTNPNENRIATRNNELYMLVTRRNELVRMVKMEQSRLEHPELIFAESIKQHITYLRTHIKEIEEKINVLIKEDAALAKRSEIIESVSGIGRTTAAVLIATVPELGNSSNKEIGALIGVVPYTRESGQFKGKAIISGGRWLPRSALFMAAMVAIRYNPLCKKFYTGLRNAGKPAKVALVAVMRKLIVIINAMLRESKVWCENQAA